MKNYKRLTSTTA